ncbi:unnamed protein product [Brassica oleracea var. botrytis]
MNEKKTKLKKRRTSVYRKVAGSSSPIFQAFWLATGISENVFSSYAKSVAS